jgi:hypothetical protein
MLAHIYYYAKSYYAALATGVLYLTTVIGPDIQFGDLAHVSLLHWLGFVGSVLGVSAGVAVITNGTKATPAKNVAPGYTITNYAPAQADQATMAPAPVDALSAPPSVYPAAAVADAEAPVEVTPIIPTVAPAQ